ncbi:D-xylose 1-dehydrogenase (NADP(+)) 2 [Cytospora mali]|uniref:D-xylose 1-dehydrogenase (NADP(+), D-xylono-1,5-lactone-forming) n=1 Tax=Cytospora mali TaxID=578113 RepID=A0A194V6S1_CYTMA|nr:D-xylose 1-dehydrogenase (NADP(+)) 2 [Valsa mali var. pyri (nom. inval.)]
MASILGAIRRNWLQANPPVATKGDDALKIGILGAAMIAPVAIIVPAISHPEVIIYAVAARDQARATAFAKKHGIPEVKGSYEALLDDPAIDAVYIPLPNGLHLEWTLKALAKGKHVLLEKPSCSNATEAEILFRSALLKAANAPVLMEAFHSRFAPAWRLFMEAIDQPNVEHALARAGFPSFIMSDGNIRFDYDLAGGAVLDIGTYTLAALRSVFGAEPEECLEADLERMQPPYDRCDGNFRAKFRFPGGLIGEMEGGLRGSNFPTSWALPAVIVTHRPVVVTDEKVSEGEEVKKTRKVTFVNFMVPPMYHRVDIEDEFVVTKKGTSDIVKKFTKNETKKAYSFKEMGVDLPGEIYWQTYRHMLEQFVNRIRGREGTVSISHEDSIAQMKALDMVYEKSGLGGI